MPSRSKWQQVVTPGAAKIAGLDPEKVIGLTGTAAELFGQWKARHPEFFTADRTPSASGESTRALNRARSYTESALHEHGLALGPWNEPTPRIYHGHKGNSFDSTLEIIEAVLNAIKMAHAPEPVNVVTWDATMPLQKINCEGQVECGTAKCVGLGINFKFIVFAGQGFVRWRGGGVGCAGNVGYGGDHISFGDAEYGHHPY